LLIDVFVVTEEKTVIELSWNNCYDYFTALKWFSMIKYHTSGLYPSLNKFTNTISPAYDELNMHCVININGQVFTAGLIWVDFEDECIDFSTEDGDREGSFLPVRIPFDYVSVFGSWFLFSRCC
jgi:hypothetical protein